MTVSSRLSSSARGAFRQLMTNSTIGAISQAFQDEGFAQNPACPYQDSSERRITAEEYLSNINWADPTVYPRVLRVFQRLLGSVKPDGIHDYPDWETFVGLMAHDGWSVDDNGHITPTRDPLLLAPEAIAQLKDPRVIHEQLDRLRRAVTNEDPAAVIGAAKELVESTAKVALSETGHEFDDHARFPKLISQAQGALALTPAKTTRGPDGTEATKKILGSVMGIAIGLDELRNRYGTGHGPGRARHGLSTRHARLAANAAITWCELILDTLTDPDAPWRKSPGNQQSSAPQ